jgi:hypothetical protein
MCLPVPGRQGSGRLTLGVGLGSDRFANEFSATGERSDDRLRATPST